MNRRFFLGFMAQLGAVVAVTLLGHDVFGQKTKGRKPAQYNPYDPYGGGWNPYDPYNPYGPWDPYDPYNPYGPWDPYDPCYGGGWNPYDPYGCGGPYGMMGKKGPHAHGRSPAHKGRHQAPNKKSKKIDYDGKTNRN